MGRDSTYVDLLRDIARVANELGVDPRQLSLAQYSRHGRFDRHVLRSFGGLASIIKANFGPAPRELDIVRAQQLRNLYVNRLERLVGEQDYICKNILDGLRRLAAEYPVEMPRKRKRRRDAKPRAVLYENVAVVSDTHFGLDIDKDEVVYNGYDWLKACRRMAMYAKAIASFQAEHRDATPRLRILLGGDLGQGAIHMNDDGQRLITEQLHGGRHILMHFIDYLRDYYDEIVVECTPDNHLRHPHRGTDRQFAQKWDSWATALHCWVDSLYRDYHDVQFNIPVTPHTYFKIFDHNAILLHGDTEVYTSNMGSTINVGKITADVNSYIAAGRPLDLMVMGHLHTPVRTTLDNGVELIVNGTGSGTDAYAMGKGFKSRCPTQVMFQSSRDDVVTVSQTVRLAAADDDSSLDDIIPPYSRPTNFALPKG